MASVEPEAAAERVYKAYTSGTLSGGIYNITLILFSESLRIISDELKILLHVVTQVKMLTWDQWPLL